MRRLNKRSWMQHPLFHLLLFFLTLYCTTLAGYELVGQPTIDERWYFNWNIFSKGLPYSLSLIGILTVHEFGHYFTARFYKVKSSLPFFIPLYLTGISIGTLGAVIRIKERITSRKIFFDIGIAGPVAGYIIAIGVIYYGFTHLPEKQDIFEIHPEYAYFGEEWEEHVYFKDTSYTAQQYLDVVGKPLKGYQPTDTIVFRENAMYLKMGSNLTFEFFKTFVADEEKLPHAFEMMHNPWLIAGFFALFFTSLNLLPIGQLDGGHVLLAFFSIKKHNKVTEGIFLLFLFYATLGMVSAHKSIPFSTFIISAFILVGIIKWIIAKMKYSQQTQWGIAAIMFMLGYAITYVFPGVSGYSNWLLFTILLGRVLGIYHPVVSEDKEMGWGRKALALFALFIFITSASPQPLLFDSKESLDFGIIELVDSFIRG